MKKDIKNYIIFILVITCCTRTSIYFFPDYEYVIITRGIHIILLFILFGYGVIYFFKKAKYKSVILINFFNNFIDWGFSFSIIGYKVFCYFIIYIYFFYKDKNFKKRTYDILLNFIFLLSLFSLIEYLIIKLGINFNFKIVNNYKQYFGSCYHLGIFNSYLVNINSGEKLERLLSIYDEPGYFGTFLGSFILFVKNEKKYKIYTICLAGILTYSTAFLYFIFMKLIIEINKKKLFQNIFIVVLGIFLFFSPINNENIQNMVIIKIEKIIKNKNLNRTSNEEEKKIEIFKKDGNIFLGERQFFENNGGNSIWMEIYRIGIIGIIVNILIFLYIADFFKIKDKKIKLLILVALMSIFQRVDILDWTTLICLYCGPMTYYLKDKNINKENVI